MARWYYAVGSEKHGPLSTERLRGAIADGRLGPDTLVWRKGFEGWQPLAATPSLQPAAATPARPAWAVRTLASRVSSKRFKSAGIGMLAAFVVLGLSGGMCFPVSLVLGAMALWSVFVGLSPRSSKTFKALERYGPIPEVVAEIDAALARAETVGPCELTRRWLVVDSDERIAAVPYDDLVWLYPQRTEHKKWGVITTRVSHAVMLGTATGELLKIPLEPKHLEAVSAHLERAAPQLVYGYDERLKKMFAEDPAGFSHRLVPA